MAMLANVFLLKSYSLSPKKVLEKSSYILFRAPCAAEAPVWSITIIQSGFGCALFSSPHGKEPNIQTSQLFFLLRYHPFSSPHKVTILYLLNRTSCSCCKCWLHHLKSQKAKLVVFTFSSHWNNWSIKALLGGISSKLCSLSAFSAWYIHEVTQVNPGLSFSITSYFQSSPEHTVIL